MTFKRILKTLPLTIASLGVLVGVGASFSLSNKQVNEVKATQHAENFDLYDYASYSGTYYDFVPSNPTEGLSGTLRTSLSSNIVPKDWYSYSGTGENTLSSILQEADEDPTNSANMIYLYTRDSVAKNPASSWNREHTWPKSLSGGNWGEGKAGTDILHLRPTYQTPNSTRSSLVFTEITGGTKRTYNGMDFGYTGGGFMPLNATKGDVARICMYVWVAYKDFYTSMPNITNVFQSYDTLLKWHTEDKPDVLEAHRNEVSEASKQKNRNPFVDHPEYAWKIFGDSCSKSVKEACMAAYPDDVSSKELTSITVNSSSVKKIYNDYDNFDPTGISVTAYYDDGTNEDVTKKVTYDKTQLRTTDTTVTVSYKYKSVTKTKDISITVNQNHVTGISLEYNNLKIVNGSSKNLIATITPSNATNKNVIWSTSNSSVCTVNNGHITAKSLGNAVITAKSEDGNYTATCSVEVSNEELIHVTGVSISDSTKTVKVGKTMTLTATVSPSDATNKSVTWSSNNTNVATVSSGTVRGVAEGSATISVTTDDGGYSASCLVTVSNGGSGGWQLVESESDLQVGNKYVIASNSKGLVAGAISSSVMGVVSAKFSSDYSSITTLPDTAVQLTLGGSSGAWTLTSDSGALGATAVKKLAWGSGTRTWSISINSSTHNATIQNGTEGYGRFLHNVNSPRFTTYTSSTSSTMLLPQLYVNSESSSMNAKQWSTLFLTDLHCDNGAHAPSTSVWSTYSSLFNDLVKDEKDKLKNAEYTRSGSFVTPSGETDVDIANAAARYDFVIGKYGVISYPNFISRSISISSINYLSSQNTTNTLMILIIVSSITFTTLITLVIIKKRRLNVINK